MTKPFAFKELSARVSALLRRPHTIEESQLTIGDLVLDRKTYSASRAGIQIRLTAKEFSLLEYFMKNPGKVLTRSEILEHVWDANGDLFSNTIETHITNLRRKIDRGHDKKLIHTLSGRGYKIEAAFF